MIYRVAQSSLDARFDTGEKMDETECIELISIVIGAINGGAIDLRTGIDRINQIVNYYSD